MKRKEQKREEHGETHREKKQHRKRDLKWMIFASLFSFVGIFLIVIWVLQTVYLQQTYKWIRENDIKKGMQSLEKVINDKDLLSAVKTASDVYGICIRIFDEQQNQLYSEENAKSCAIHKWKDEDIAYYTQLAKTNGGFCETDIFSGEGRPKGKTESATEQESGAETEKYQQMFEEEKTRHESVVWIKEVPTDRHGTYTVMLNIVITPVKSTVRTIRLQLVAVSTVFLLMAAVLALFMTRRIARPIVRINESAKELAKGNFNVVFDRSGYREVSELGETLTIAAQDLGKTDRLQQELIANVSHDLRTPLTMIIGYSEVMRDIPGENTAENVQVVIDEARRLTGLVNDLLDMSRIQAGAAEYSPVEYDLTESIEAIIDRIAKMVENNGYNIEFEYQGHVLVYADEQKIYQVVYNLIGNAINYTGQDQRVVVKQELRGENVRISVMDTGAGIDPKDLDLVWQRYYKVDKTHKRAIMGNGLGLSIAHNILKLHGADYGVESQVGRGSTFWFELKTTK